MATTPVPGVAIKNSGVAEAANVYRKARADDRKADAQGAGELSTKGFAQMLSSAKQPQATPKEQVAETEAEPVGLELLAQQAIAAADNDLSAWVADGLSLQSLMDQKAQMEQVQDLASVNAASVLATQTAISEGAVSTVQAAGATGVQATSLPPATTILGAAGRDVIAVVAQGVEQAEDLAGLPEAVETPSLDGALAQPAVAKAGEKVEARPEPLKGWSAEPLRGERSAEGKFDLEGQWTAADRQSQPTEAMQRVLGQMTQFLSANAVPGLAGARRNGVGADGRSSATDWDGTMAAQSGNGTARLTDYAVSQTASSQQAQNGDTPSPESQPNMAFWMNSRQQRAEMLLDRDGQAVRVQVTLDGNAAHITFRSDEQATRSMLDASVAQLRDMLAAQGVELAGVHVNTQAGSGGSDGEASANGRHAEGVRRVRLNVADLMESSDATARIQSMDSGRGLDVFA